MSYATTWTFNSVLLNKVLESLELNVNSYILSFVEEDLIVQDHYTKRGFSFQINKSWQWQQLQQLIIFNTLLAIDRVLM